MIIHGHALEKLRKLPAKSVHMCVTSPPYYKQRRYGGVDCIWETAWNGEYDLPHDHEWTAGVVTTESSGGSPSQREGKSRMNGSARKVKYMTCHICGAWMGELGWEPNVEMYINHLMQIFKEVHRVLRDDGLCFVNITDTYHRKVRYCVPERFVLAMEAKWIAGWLPVQDLIWYKRNPMIESVRNRCTKAHEYIYIFSKTRNYFFDNEAIKEDIVEYERARRLREKKQGLKTKFNLRADDKTGLTNQSDTGAVRNVEARQQLAEYGKRNKRSVWEVNNIPFDGDHYATFSAEIPMLCIQAGTSEHGCCPVCKAPYKRILKPSADYEEVLGEGYHDHSEDDGKGMMQARKRNTQNKMRDAGVLSAEYKTTGWKPSCDCESKAKMQSDYIFYTEEWKRRIPATVLDPFAGAGTTGLQASKLGRNFILIEAKKESVTLINNQMKKLGLFNPVT